MRNILMNFWLLIILSVVFVSCNNQCGAPKEKTDWQTDFQQKLPLLGHRNWILVVDKAFPLQSAAGMTVINTGESLPLVLQEVMGSISKSTHVKPIVFTDLELKDITGDLSPGADSLKKNIDFSLKGFERNTILHQEVFAKLDSASKMFQVLVLKTESTIPYSSIFIQLDCAYWDGVREMKLRKKMGE